MKMMDVLPNAQFQLVQKSTDTLLLRIGTGKPVPESMLMELKSIINEAMGFPCTMRIEQMECIPRSNNGTYEEFLSEVDRV